jgi:CRISPR/Cas system Type II protein with McrA/HNH and RuvC-like nuclease domain
MVLDDRIVKEFLQNPSKLNLMRIVMKSLYINDKNKKRVDTFYEIENFKRKYEDFTSESQEDSVDSEEILERTIKKPKRNDNEFLEHIKELNFMCSGVPGKACRLKGQQLDKEDFDYDHIWPWKFSKDDSRKNKRPLCVSCHRWKTNNIDKHLKDDHEAVQMLQNENMLPDRLMKLVHPHCIPCLYRVV